MARKVRIRVLADSFAATADDSILRALQEYGIARNLPSYGFTRFCWNASCEQCILSFDRGAGSERDFACLTSVCEGMEIHSLPAVLYWRSMRSRGS